MRQYKAVLSLLLLNGCATSALDMAPPSPDQPWAPAITSTGEIIPGASGAASGNGYVLPPNTALGNLPQSPRIDPSKAYTLPELIDIAESNDPATRIAWENARKAALAAGIAESAFLPNLTASAVGAYQDNSSNTSAQGGSVSGNDTAHGVISAVSLNWLLFDFGERSALVDVAKQGSVISNIAFTAAHQQLIYNVSLAYYANEAARDHVATAAQTLATAKTVQAAAEDRYDHGIGTTIEVAQARQATAQAELAMVQANGGEQDAYLALLTAMGISPLTKITIAPLPHRDLSPAMDAPVESIISTALARRPDVLSAYAAQQQSLAGVQAARDEFLPKVFLSATGAYNSSSLSLSALPSVGGQAATENLSGHQFGGAILAGVTFPLYDGGTRAAILDQAKAQEGSADAALNQVQDEAVRQIALANNSVHTSLAAYSAAQELAAAAQTTFDAALTAYRSGVGSITDLTVAESQLSQAQDAATDAYSAALSAAATLAFSTGALGASPQ